MIIYIYIFYYIIFILYTHCTYPPRLTSLLRDILVSTASEPQFLACGGFPKGPLKDREDCLMLPPVVRYSYHKKPM